MTPTQTQPDKKEGRLLTLPSGKQAYLSIRHLYKARGDDYNGTLARLRFTWTEGVLIGLSRCSDRDQFCRRTGRKLAATRLLEWIRNAYGLPKEDRAAIFRAICPEYFRKQ
jgi:hypothetical protein